MCVTPNKMRVLRLFKNNGCVQCHCAVFREKGIPLKNQLFAMSTFTTTNGSTTVALMLSFLQFTLKTAANGCLYNDKRSNLSGRLSKCVVLYQYDTTRHMCLVNDMTQQKKDTKIFFKKKTS